MFLEDMEAPFQWNIR